MFLIGIGSVLGMYALLQALWQNTALSLMGAWAFNWSPSFFYYTINPLPDNLALCFGLWGLALFFIWLRSKRRGLLVAGGLLLALSTLCKLPFIIFFVVPGMHFLMALIRGTAEKNWFGKALSNLGFAVLPLAWYAWVIPGWHENPIVKSMPGNNKSTSLLLNYYQNVLTSIVPELLLNYGAVLFFLARSYFLFKRKAFKDSRFIPILGLSVGATAYYLFEANAIAKIHDYYLFPFYPLLFMLVAYGAYHLYTSTNRLGRIVATVFLLVLPLTCHLRMMNRWNPDSPGFNKELG